MIARLWGWDGATHSAQKTFWQLREEPRPQILTERMVSGMVWHFWQLTYGEEGLFVDENTTPALTGRGYAAIAAISLHYRERSCQNKRKK